MSNFLVVFEPLEPRLLLSGDLLAGGYWVGANFISPEWFETLVVSSAHTGGSALQFAGGTTDEAGAGAANQWIVQFTASAIAQVASVAGTASLLGGAPGDFQVLGGLGMAGQVLISTGGLDAHAVEAWLGSNPNVAYYEQDLVLAVDVIPNDSSFTTLWGLNNTGQSGGTVDVDIDAPEAWQVTTGSRSIVVAVIDTGIDYLHPDLGANMWRNPGEIPGNRIDDDGNGFVDDVYGYDFANEDGNPMDDNGHGTHVAGTIAAVGNNGIGVTGVNWSASVMALKFLDSSGSGYTSNAVRALNYATMMKTRYGVNVVLTNNSWGGGGYSSSLYNAIAASRDANMLFVAAAGNSAQNNDTTPSYPSCYNLDNVISVAAIDRNGNLASFSSYGATSVDLAAPGVSIYSTVPNSSYASYSGTSMATPHVSGVAALAWSVQPGASYQQVRNSILGGVDPSPVLSGKTVTGGRLNAARTLELMGMRVTESSPAAGAILGSAPRVFRSASLAIATSQPSMPRISPSTGSPPAPIRWSMPAQFGSPSTPRP